MSKYALLHIVIETKNLDRDLKAYFKRPLLFYFSIDFFGANDKNALQIV